MENKTLAPKDAYELLYREYPDVVNVDQMREMLGNIGRGLAYRILSEQQIQCLKLGKAYRIPKTSIINFLLFSG
jgi:hypothetical protein